MSNWWKIVKVVNAPSHKMLNIITIVCDWLAKFIFHNNALIGNKFVSYLSVPDLNLDPLSCYSRTLPLCYFRCRWEYNNRIQPYFLEVKFCS